MKERRHAKILELIGKFSIDTQEELLRRLREEGFEVTQATVSRDIKELRLIKALSPDGKYQYSTGQESSKDLSSKFAFLLADNAVSVSFVGNILVIKCLTGMANAVCAAMDLVEWEGIVGTLAGDDTIFVLMQNEEEAGRLCGVLQKMLR
jgi:transcriptional regulator of arginine metabolism